MEEIDLSTFQPEKIQEAEAAFIKAILPKLAGLKKIIAVTEARAKELLEQNPNVFDGEWVLKEGATDRRVSDPEAFVEAMMALKNPLDEYPIGARDLLGIATFPIGKAEKLVMAKFGWPAKIAKMTIESFGEKVISIGRKAPTLQEVTK